MNDFSRTSAKRLFEIFVAFLRLGCTSFGGPIAHLGYFQAEFVDKRCWLAQESFSELVAIAQTLPGPASSQVGYGIGLTRGGLPGGICAWFGFTLPSAILMMAFAFGHSLFSGTRGIGFLHGLQIAAVGVVAQAVVSMQRSLAPDRGRFGIAFAAAAMVLLIPSNLATLLAIVSGACAGAALGNLGGRSSAVVNPIPPSVSRITATLSLVVFSLFLCASVVFASPSVSMRSLFSSFFRSGAFVFGGGHVVLPLLENLTVAHGWISQDRFLAGYGAAQAVPGPLFTFSAYLGAVIHPNSRPICSSVVAIFSLFLPGLLLMTGVLPFWGSFRNKFLVRKCLDGVNAAVVGVLLAALFNPIWTSSIHSPVDFLIALATFVLLIQWRAQPWLVVLLAGVIVAVA